MVQDVESIAYMNEEFETLLPVMHLLSIICRAVYSSDPRHPILEDSIRELLEYSDSVEFNEDGILALMETTRQLTQD